MMRSNDIRNLRHAFAAGFWKAKKDKMTAAERFPEPMR
jgi:hypothetical protein